MERTIKWIVQVFCVVNVVLANCPADKKLLQAIQKQPFPLQKPVIVLNDVNDSCDNEMARLIIKSYHGMWRASNNLTVAEKTGSSLTFLLARNPFDLHTMLDFIAKEKLGTKIPILILSLTLDYNHVPIKVNQLVFLLNLNDFVVTELYHINGYDIRRRVGQFNNGLDFVWNPSWSLDLRSNLMGQFIVAMTEHLPPYSPLKEGFQTGAPFNEGNQTYDVTEWAGGMYPELLYLMSQKLNFTYRIYKRKDGQWGTKVNNQTVGILSNLEDGSTDIVASAFGFNLVRLPYVNPLPMLTAKLPAIFIKRKLVEDFSWTILLSPFSYTLWACLGLIAILIASWFSLVQFPLDKNTRLAKWTAFLEMYLGWMWIAFTANFGNKPKQAQKRTSNRMLLFSCLLAGNIMWMGYRASITSELSHVKIKLPIDSLESVVGSPFTFATYSKGSTTAELFTHAKEGTVVKEIFEKHMTTEDSFVLPAKGLELMMDLDRYAYYEDPQLILGVPGYDCQIQSVWRAPVPVNLASFTMSKHSPYHEVIQRQLLDLRESGQIDHVKTRHLLQEPQCDSGQKTADPLTFKKLVSLFFIPCFGIVLSISIFALERLGKSIGDWQRRRQLQKALSNVNAHDIKDFLTDFKQRIGTFDDPKLLKDFQDMTLQDLCTMLKHSKETKTQK